MCWDLLSFFFEANRAFSVAIYMDSVITVVPHMYVCVGVKGVAQFGITQSRTPLLLL